MRRCMLLLVVLFAVFCNDSPPTVCQGRVLLGSADGWVYCLQAADNIGDSSEIGRAERSD